MSTCSLNCVESCDIGYTHFCLRFVFLFFFANSQNVAKLLFQTPPRQFLRFVPNFAQSICGPSWQKAIKRILIFPTVLNLWNKNFLYIVAQNRKCCISPHWTVSMTCNSGDYFPMSSWGSAQNFGRWPLGGALYIEVFYISTSVGRIKTKLGRLLSMLSWG